MADEKPLQREIDELLKAMGSMSASAAPQESPAGKGEKGAPFRADAASLELLRDVLLDVRVELGRTRMPLEAVAKLGSGVVVELDRLAGEPVDVYVNDVFVARGEVVVVEDRLSVRVTDVRDFSPAAAR